MSILLRLASAAQLRLRSGTGSHTTEHIIRFPYAATSPESPTLASALPSSSPCSVNWSFHFHLAHSTQLVSDGKPDDQPAPSPLDVIQSVGRNGSLDPRKKVPSVRKVVGADDYKAQPPIGRRLECGDLAGQVCRINNAARGHDCQECVTQGVQGGRLIIKNGLDVTRTMARRRH